MAEQTEPPPPHATNGDVAHASGTVAVTPKRAQVLVANPVLLARVLGFLGSKYAFTLGAFVCCWSVWLFMGKEEKGWRVLNRRVRVLVMTTGLQ